MKNLTMTLILLFAWGVQAVSGLEQLPIQDGGRLKPFDSFAREVLLLVHGKNHFERRNPSEIVFTWILQPTAWQEKQLFEVKYRDLKTALRLDESQSLFTYKQLVENDRLPLLVQDLQSKKETKEKLDPFYQSIQRLENQLGTFREIASGRLIKLVPNPSSDSWLGLPELDDELQAEFLSLSKIFVESLSAQVENNPNRKELINKVQSQVESFKTKARAKAPSLYVEENKIKAEVAYNLWHPFGWASLVFLISSVLLTLAWMFENKKLYKVSWIVVSLGLLLTVVGFAFRIYLTGRPPVSNMYETVVWVGFGSVLFAMIFEKIYRWKFILLAGSIVGALCFIIADRAPAVLDASLTPLEAVLRSNLWLTVHVLTITISYAAFFLAFVLGDIGLILYLRKSVDMEKIKAIVLAIYRSIQVGVALLAPGIILGGVWADYSWGRFWGWDPKETWALIALLGYLAVLHGRLVGWIKELGMLASAVVAFSLVIMAWYGVNFVLGAGLHSYGFGAGGVEYVSSFVAIHLVFVIYVLVANRTHKNSA
jgi:ABC-type transport system involved in cytochrome c biogenesis permease subunit